MNNFVTKVLPAKLLLKSFSRWSPSLKKSPPTVFPPTNLLHSNNTVPLYYLEVCHFRFQAIDVQTLESHFIHVWQLWTTNWSEIYFTHKKKTRIRQYPAETMTNTDYADNIALLANAPTQAESLLHSLEQAASGIGFDVNADKIKSVSFNQDSTSISLTACPWN